MSNVSKILLAAGLIIIGILSLLRLLGVFSFSTEIAGAYFLLFYGLVFVSANLGKDNRGMLFLGAVIFIAGVVLFVIFYYEILSPIKTLLPSILFAVGSGFLILYIDNKNEKVFLIVAIILYLASFLLIKLTDSFPAINYANRIAFVILELWPVLILLLGISLLINRKKQ